MGAPLIAALLLLSALANVAPISSRPGGSTGINTPNYGKDPSSIPGTPTLTDSLFRDSSDPAFPSLAEGAKLTRGQATTACGSCNLYMQEGTTIQLACFSGAPSTCTTYSGFSAVYVDVTVEDTPYPTGFELNGWSNTGDWYQSMILLNWCASGFSVGNEAFDNSGTSVYPSSGGAGCYGSMVISAGDTVQLGLSVTQSGAQAGEVCFTAADLSAPQSPYSSCINQPDPGGSPQDNYFAFGASNGFFTGPMTEILGGNSSTCLGLGQMPSITYEFARGAYITQATPWSDEWNPGQSLVCYSTVSSNPWTFSANDPTNYVTDASADSPYGPHWEVLANISSSAASATWMFESDATLAPPTASHDSIDVGQYSSVLFSDDFFPVSLSGKATFLGWSFTSPLTGCAQPASAPWTLNCATPAIPGVSVVFFNVSEGGGYDLIGPPLVFTIFSPPVIDSVSSNPRQLDLGQAAKFSVSSSGGSGGLSASWSNLPPGCVADSSTTFTCSPSALGLFDVEVRVTDSNGVISNLGTVTVSVLSDPTVGPLSLTPSASRLDVGQTLSLNTTAQGGTGSYAFSWAGLPPGCLSLNSSILSCRPTTPGQFDISLQATDSAGYPANSTTDTVRVYPDPTLQASADSVSLIQGQSLVLTINVTGGDPPFSSSWEGLPEGCLSTDSLVIACTPTSTGSEVVRVHVTDSAGFVRTIAINVSVAPTFLGTSLSPTVGWGLVAAGTGAAAVVLAVLIGRNRRRHGPRGPS